MLKLKVPIGDCVMIGPVAGSMIDIKVDRVTSKTAHLCFEAPRSIPINRESVVQARSDLQRPARGRAGGRTPFACTVRVFTDWREEPADSNRPFVKPQHVARVSRTWFLDMITPTKFEELAPAGELPESVRTLPEALQFAEELTGAGPSLDWRLSRDDFLYAPVSLSADDLRYVQARLAETTLDPCLAPA